MRNVRDFFVIWKIGEFWSDSREIGLFFFLMDKSRIQFSWYVKKREALKKVQKFGFLPNGGQTQKLDI